MNSKDLVSAAMAGKRPERTPVMCQMANGHTIIQTGVHPIDYFLDDQLWADCLVKMREQYGFDGILCHKPGRIHGLMDLVESVDRDMEVPTLYMSDGARIECTRDDDAYYKPSDDFSYPTLEELDPADLLGWAPESFRAFQASKATFPIADPDDLAKRRDDHGDAVDGHGPGRPEVGVGLGALPEDLAGLRVQPRQVVQRNDEDAGDELR